LPLEAVDGADLLGCFGDRGRFGDRGLQGGDLGVVGGDDAKILVGEGGADRRVESPRGAEEQASIRRDGVVLAEQVLQSGGVAALRMAARDGLLELLGIAEKQHASCVSVQPTAS
jgi:hypothetical protein